MEPTINQLDELHQTRTDLTHLDLSTVPGRMVALDLVTTMERILGQIRDAEDEAEHLQRMADMDRSILRINELGREIATTNWANHIENTIKAREIPIVTLNPEEEAAFDELEAQARKS